MGVNKVSQYRIAEFTGLFLQKGRIYASEAKILLKIHRSSSIWIRANKRSQIFLTLAMFVWTSTVTSHTNLLTPCSRVLPEKIAGLQLIEKIPAFYGTLRFIAAVTSVRQLSLSRASSIQSITPYPTSWRSTLILSSHLCLGLPCRLLPSGFLIKTPHTSLTFATRATCLAHLILLDFVTRRVLSEEYGSLNLILLTLRIWWAPNNASKWQMGFNSAFKGLISWLCIFLHSPVTSCLLGPNILLNTYITIKHDLQEQLETFAFIRLVIWYFHSRHFLFFLV